jgi:Ca2+-binding EF-hand superfamily protein
LFPKKTDLQALHKYYDIDGDGNICYEEFLRGLRYNKNIYLITLCRDNLTERKKKMVDKAFRSLDKDGSGVVNV